MSKKLTIIVLAFLSLLLLSGYLFPVNNNQKIDEYYIKQLQVVKRTLQDLRQSARMKRPVPELKKLFKEARLAYKKVAILIEYFNVYEAKYLNGPALKKVEEDNPTVIVEPQGFQVLEEKLFGTWHASKYKLIVDDIGKMLVTVDKLLKEPDREYKFRDERVFDALRAAVLRIITMGISGFDSPIAQHSLAEAAATIDGMQSILNLYQTELEKKQPGAYRQLSQTLANAKKNLLTNTSFPSFDRLQFITSYANPLSAAFVKTRLRSGYTLPEERTPVNPGALTIFDNDAFDINFFSPTDRYRVTAERIILDTGYFMIRFFQEQTIAVALPAINPKRPLLMGCQPL